MKIRILKIRDYNMAFFLRALADLGHIELDDSSWANIAKATQLNDCSSAKRRSFVIEFSSATGEDSIVKLAQAARQIDVLRGQRLEGRRKGDGRTLFRPLSL